MFSTLALFTRDTISRVLFATALKRLSPPLVALMGLCWGKASSWSRYTAKSSTSVRTWPVQYVVKCKKKRNSSTSYSLLLEQVLWGFGGGIISSKIHQSQAFLCKMKNEDTRVLVITECRKLSSLTTIHKCEVSATGRVQKWGQFPSFHSKYMKHRVFT